MKNRFRRLCALLCAALEHLLCAARMLCGAEVRLCLLYCERRWCHSHCKLERAPLLYGWIALCSALLDMLLRK